VKGQNSRTWRRCAARGSRRDRKHAYRHQQDGKQTDQGSLVAIPVLLATHDELKERGVRQRLKGTILTWGSAACCMKVRDFESPACHASIRHSSRAPCPTMPPPFSLELHFTDSEYEGLLRRRRATHPPLPERTDEFGIH